MDRVSAIFNGAETLSYVRFLYSFFTLVIERIITAGLSRNQDLEMVYDALGNLETRIDHRQGSTENHCYDSLNRLTGSAVDSACGAGDISYNALGNITYKEGVGNYSYGAGNTSDAGTAGPHAVVGVTNGGSTVTYAYDNNGNMTSDDEGRTLDYTAFDKPFHISKGSDIDIDFQYGPDRSRYRRIDSSSDGVTTTHYLGGVEFIDKDGVTEIKRYVGNLVITERRNSDGRLQSWDEQYLLKDHLGSTHVVVGRSSADEQLMSFDAWGQRRDAVDLETVLSDWSVISGLRDLTTRGFTGHEMLDAVGLIHMNGRVYDPRLGRFLQADPFIDGETFTQGYNRYSYVYNNPLNATDPTGHFVFTLAAIAYTAAAEGIKWYVASAIFAAAGFADALVQGASFNDALKAGVVSGVSAAAFHGVGEAFSQASASNISQGLEGLIEFGSHGGEALMLTGGQVAGKIAAHAAVGGVMSVLQGGEFGHGFVSAGIVGAASPALGKIDGLTVGDISLGQVAASAVLGGTVSKITGGKFSNGAMTGAFQNLFNQQGAATKRGRMAKAQKLKQQRINNLLKGAQDGHITLAEAKAWYQHGNGSPLTADMSKIDFGSISAADFPNGVGSSEYINTFFKGTPDGRVYGSIKLTLTSQNTVTATFGYDDYDFNINWNDGRHARNVFTKMGDVYHGKGTPFRINLQGTGTLNP